MIGLKILLLVFVSESVINNEAAKVPHDLTAECLHSICGDNCFQRPNCCASDEAREWKGPFFISKPYWRDAGYPTLPFDAADRKDAFESCVCDYGCATTVVNGYMLKHSRDCNGDGVVNCEDYRYIHQHGYGGCSVLTKPKEGDEVTPEPDIDIRGQFPT